MRLSLFNYHLPKSYIAQKPVRPRDSSRLLVLGRNSGKIKHSYFFQIEEFLKKGDVLVVNNSKVIPARLIGKKYGTGGKIEIFLLKETSSNKWEVLIGGKGRKAGMQVVFKEKLCGEIIEKSEQKGTWLFKFNCRGHKLKRIIEKIGTAPTPPYIKKASNLREYQTVYAQKKGSVAAPTAGFHFTDKLIQKLKRKGVQFETITLHVGLGTFQPVKEKDIQNHKMHPEFTEIKKSVIDRLVKAKREGRRIIAVGTTSVRTLEAVIPILMERNRKPGFWLHDIREWINIFIYPGYKFNFVDGVVTNFHVPKSTLLMLVSAFAGKKNILRAYEIAKRKKYRFYSFGDAMLII